MATMGLNLTVGYAGQMSLGQAAFFGIGAYHAAILLKLGWPFFVVLPVAAVACFVVGLALGFPALRVQHHYLAFATLGFNVLVFLVMRNEEKLTGGTFGISAHSAADAVRASTWAATSPISTSRWRRWSCSACCCGGCCARRGAARSPRCATTRSAPRASASTSPPTRCSRSRSAPRAPASAASISRRWSSSSSRGRSISRPRSRCCSRSSSAAPGGSSARWSAPLIIVLLPEMLRASSAPWLKFMQTWYLAVFGIAVVVLMVWLPGGLLSIPERFKAQGTAPR